MYEAIFPNLQNIPWGIIIIAFIGGFIVARKFPALFPSFFAPQKSQAELIEEIIKRLNPPKV